MIDDDVTHDHVVQFNINVTIVLDQDQDHPSRIIDLYKLLFPLNLQERSSTCLAGYYSPVGFMRYFPRMTHTAMYLPFGTR